MTERERMRRLLEDLRDNGLRCDLMPTMMLRNMHQLYGDFAVYLQRADKRIRERAQEALLDSGLYLTKEEAEKVRAGLEWLASDEAWEVTLQYATDGRYRFNTTRDSVYATPWGFARELLALLSPEQSQEGR